MLKAVIVLCAGVLGWRLSLIHVRTLQEVAREADSPAKRTRTLRLARLVHYEELSWLTVAIGAFGYILYLFSRGA